MYCDCVIDLSLEAETSGKAVVWKFSLGTRVGVDWIRRNCELEISRPLLTMDRRIMNGLIDGTLGRHKV